MYLSISREQARLVCVLGPLYVVGLSFHLRLSVNALRIGYANKAIEFS